MWVSSLLTSSAASLGRVVLVGFIPNAIPAIFVVLLVRAQSFSGPSRFTGLLGDLRPDALSVLLFVLAVALLSILVQPFQLRVLRVLEGYWDSWALTARIAPIFVEFQRRRREKLVQILEENPPARPAGSLTELLRHHRDRARFDSRRRRAGRRLGRYPAPLVTGSGHVTEIPLLPTGLGNTLKAGETSAGERYGLDTLSSWPRLYPFFPPAFAEGQASARDALDAAANLCVNFFVVTVLGVVALHDEPAHYWIIALAAALCCLSYVGAVATAADYNVLIQTAYDLYRFELLKNGRYPLPKDPAEELATFTRLSKLYTADPWREGGARALTSRVMAGTGYDDNDDDSETDGVIAAIRRRFRRNP
ncbi:hypothetical protein [Lentzea sp. E54]|uniref:hypothetical protein n=1 Tax=Lentzea xerophila TaxID=3435883 RepID=UPI003DA2A0FA